MAHFLQGVTETKGDYLLGIGGSICKSISQIFFAWRHDEEVHQAGRNDGVIAGTHLGSTLDINIHYHVLATLEEFENFRFQGPVEVLMNFSVFDEMSRCRLGLKSLPAQEVVITGVDFTVPCWPRSAGNRVMGFTVPGQSSAEGGLSGTRGAGDEEQNTGSRGHGISLREKRRGCKSSG